VRVLLTGGRGFVGGWLARELTGAGHQVSAPSREQLDVTDRVAVQRAFHDLRPEGVVHLAAVALAADARRDPGNALAIAAGGTQNLLEMVRASDVAPATLVVSSSEVYGHPRPEDLPLREDAPLGARSPYALTKLAQESVALAAAGRWGLPVVVVRAFNHTGPGQRPGFVVPDLAARVRQAARGEAPEVRAGNLGTRRDFTDVRDVVVAYRLLLEAAANGRVAAGGAVFNVASGRSVAISSLLEQLGQLAGIRPRVVVDPELVRPDEAPEIRGDTTALRELTGWQPEHSLAETLADVWAANEDRTP
jgi:GDP-4-dehydro-6-deoxy-D-mannose reductase